MTDIIAQDHSITLIVDFLFDPKHAHDVIHWLRTLSHDNIARALLDARANCNKMESPHLWHQLSFNPQGRLVASDGRTAAISPDLLPSAERVLAGFADKQPTARTARSSFRKAALWIASFLPGCGYKRRRSEFRSNRVFSGVAPFEIRLGDAIHATYSFALSVSAAKRLPHCPMGERLLIEFESVKIYLPGSGCGLMVWQGGVADPLKRHENHEINAEWIVEALHELGHAKSHAAALTPTSFATVHTASAAIKAGDWLYLNGDAEPGPDSVWQPPNSTRASYEALVLSTPVVNQARANIMYWPCTMQKEKPVSLSFTLLELSREVAGFGGRQRQDARNKSSKRPLFFVGGNESLFGKATQRRWYSYTQALLAEGTPDADAEILAQRLGGRFTTDYGDLTDPSANFQKLKLFNNIQHLISTQGAATIVTNTGTQHDRQFITDRGQQVYLPICLLAYHTYVHLIELTEQSGFFPNEDDPGEDLEKIERLRTRLARYRLFFRAADVSTLRPPNAVYHAWREAFATTDKERRLEKDLEYAKLILEHVNDQRARWADRILRGGMGIAGAAGVVVAIKHFTEALIHQCVIQPERWQMLLYSNPNNLERKALTEELAKIADRVHHWEQMGFWVGLVLAMVVFFLSFVLGKKPPPGGGH